MNLSQLRAAIAVADYGNFSEAALQLELSQPAVSHAIATLEEELGVPLFTRGRRGALPTPAGEKILKHARQVQNHLDLIQKEANLQRGLQGGQVRIASFRSVATHILPKVIVQFRERYPDIGISLIERSDYQDVERCLREGQVDLGITYLPTSDEFEVWELLRDEYVILFPPKSKIPNPLKWSDLIDYSFIQLPGLPCGYKLHEHMKRCMPALSTASDIQEDSTIVSMVMQGLAPAILPRLAAEPIPPEIVMRALPETCERIIGVASLSSTLHIPAVFAFLEQLKQLDLSMMPLLGVHGNRAGNPLSLSG
jgi:DNA-binding transcriptional LysR family regulator